MSVAVLKADNELGYWEYSVKTETDEWTIEFSRAEEAGPEHSENEDMWRLHMNLKRNGEKFFNSWEYGDNYPFLTNHDLNGLHAASAIASLAYWYIASARVHEMRNIRDRITGLIGENMPGDILDVLVLPADGGVLDDQYILTKEDCVRIGPEDRPTHDLYLELHHYGMATTTKEWRIAIFGKDDIQPSWWGREHRDDCGHEH